MAEQDEVGVSGEQAPAAQPSPLNCLSPGPLWQGAGPAAPRPGLGPGAGVAKALCLPMIVLHLVKRG